MSTLSEKIMVLLGDPSVTSIVGTRSYRMRAPQSQTIIKDPYIIVWFPTHEQVGHLRGVTNLEHPVVRFDMFGSVFPPIDTLRATIINLMCSQMGAVYRFGTELYEDDTRLYHLMADFSVWHTIGT